MEDSPPYNSSSLLRYPLVLGAPHTSESGGLPQPPWHIIRAARKFHFPCELSSNISVLRSYLKGFSQSGAEALPLDNFPVSPSTSPLRTQVIMSLASKAVKKKETNHHRINGFHVSIRVTYSRASWRQKHT